MKVSIYDFSDAILKDLKKLYENGEIPKKKRLEKSPAIKHMIEQTGEILEFAGKYIKRDSFDKFYETYTMKFMGWFMRNYGIKTVAGNRPGRAITISKREIRRRDRVRE